MKIVLKVLALPLLFIVTVACILGNLITNISSYLIAKQTVETILNIDKKKEQEKEQKKPLR